MKKWLIAAAALVLLASLGMAAFAAETGGAKPVSSIEKITGTVTEIRPQINADGTVSTTQAYVLIKSKDGGLTMFYINANSCSISGGKLSDISVGSRVTGSYDATRPVLMVNPPQFTATAVTLH